MPMAFSVGSSQNILFLSQSGTTGDVHRTPQTRDPKVESHQGSFFPAGYVGMFLLHNQPLVVEPSGMSLRLTFINKQC